MEEKALEEIGLTKSEIKVYLALLELGPSTTGPIITSSKTADSKIYEVLEKLANKGLASSFLKGGLKHYKAASPSMILEYLREKKKRVEEEEASVVKILPSLLSLEKQAAEEKEASLFTGARGVKTPFSGIVEELKKGEEVHIMGIYEFGKQFLRAVQLFHKNRSEKGVKAKILINSGAIETAKGLSSYSPVEIRFMPKDIFTPAVFLIYNDKVVISLGDEFTMFVIKSKSAAKAFNSYFEVMWESASLKPR
ncbi:HTH-type sugar sensing transcriptional regulator TrmBL1 [Candidatus Gugararchaeum adminiculabundum]|nr:HTH-type sugar sensing transcriptional regulator TrmBL1 [Candidatus Gugararchaeum adminiculabundum]